MICELFIQNVAVIEKLSVDFKKGMSVLTGETGAGKSIIIDSINMILGNKADKSLIRYGEEKAVVQAIFDVSEELSKVLEEKDIEAEDGQVIITRTISAEGKSVCKIGGMAVSLSFLREIAPLLINIHGQHDNQALLTPEKHILFLDAYAKNAEKLSEYKELYSKLKDAEKRLRDLFCDDDERLRRADLLEYQTNEIYEADLKEGEEEDLKEQRDKIENAEKITSSVNEARDALYSGEGSTAYDAVFRAVSSLEKITGIDDEIDRVYNALNEILYSVQDLSGEISGFAEGVEYNEAVLNDIEERLDIYSKLKRKYGDSVAKINEFYEKALSELEILKNVDENIEKVKKEIDDLTKKITKCAAELSDIRNSFKAELEERIETALFELNMEKAKFKVNIEKCEGFSPDGIDKVEFLISANAGEPLKQLVKIASGGELSRVMLAIKSILAECDGVDTLIFDEIDTGVSGNAAQKIADKLSSISRIRQVICITHLPQLAAIADNHYYIEKMTKDEKTKTKIKVLEYDERIDEIARITGGEITDISKEHARELIEKASERKCR